MQMKGTEDIFDEAVNAARNIIETSISKYVREVSFVLEALTNINVLDKVPVLKKNVRLSYLDIGAQTYYRIKLFEGDDEHSVECNKKLIEIAKFDPNLFDDLCEQIAYELEEDYEVSPLFKSFVASVLRADITRPRNGRSPDLAYRNAIEVAIEVLSLLYSDSLKLTRNDESKTNISILDAISVAAKSLGYKCEFATLKKNFYPKNWIYGVMKQAIEKYPDEDPYLYLRQVRNSLGKYRKE